jgi:hypothetical protein
LKPFFTQTEYQRNRLKTTFNRFNKEEEAVLGFVQKKFFNCGILWEPRSAEYFGLIWNKPRLRKWFTVKSQVLGRVWEDIISLY